MALRGLKITWECITILFISCSIILSERLPNFPPLMNVLKRFFFDGAYIEKWGMVFWGESNKEEFYFILLWP